MSRINGSSRGRRRKQGPSELNVHPHQSWREENGSMWKWGISGPGCIKLVSQRGFATLSLTFFQFLMLPYWVNGGLRLPHSSATEGTRGWFPKSYQGRTPESFVMSVWKVNSVNQEKELVIQTHKESCSMWHSQEPPLSPVWAVLDKEYSFSLVSLLRNLSFVPSPLLISFCSSVSFRWLTVRVEMWGSVSCPLCVATFECHLHVTLLCACPSCHLCHPP